MAIKSYNWTCALVQAEREGKLSKSTVNMALRLATAINWDPRDGRKPGGLYWKNEEAFRHVGTSRSTYFRNIHELKEQGFIYFSSFGRGYNIMATYPKSQSGTDVDQENEPQNTESPNLGLSESQSGTPESPNLTPHVGKKILDRECNLTQEQEEELQEVISSPMASPTQEEGGSVGVGSPLAKNRLGGIDLMKEESRKSQIGTLTKEEDMHPQRQELRDNPDPRIQEQRIWFNEHKNRYESKKTGYFAATLEQLLNPTEADW